MQLANCCYVLKSVPLPCNKVLKNVLYRHYEVSKSVVCTHIYVLKNVNVYMELLVTQQLKAWKLSAHRKPLILNGARQVGKTWALRAFAHTSYAKEA